MSCLRCKGEGRHFQRERREHAWANSNPFVDVEYMCKPECQARAILNTIAYWALIAYETWRGRPKRNPTS